MGHEVGEDLKHFGPEPQGVPGTVQSIELGVERPVLKAIAHGSIPRSKILAHVTILVDKARTSAIDLSIHSDLPNSLQEMCIP
jgi:hypothetical protein